VLSIANYINMKLWKIAYVLILLVAVTSASWYYRPWSDYSPSKMAALDDVSQVAKNFRSMGEIIPYRVVRGGENVTEFVEAIKPLELNLNYQGKEKSVKQFLNESGTTGMIVLHKGVLVHEQYLNGGARESLFTSWSVAKSFVATAIVMAHKEGLIASLDDKVALYAPQYSGSAYGDTSIKSLLAMSSGIDFIEEYAADDSDIRPFFFDSFILGRNPDGLLTKFKRNRDEFSDFHYISSNSHVLSSVLNGVYKKPLADIISEKIWQPLGMEASATWLQHRNDDKGVALGYCCLNARLRDYARFGQFYLDASKGRGKGVDSLPSSWPQSLLKPATPAHAAGGDNYSGRGYSYHFWLPVHEKQVFLAVGIYGQFIWIDPKREIVIVKTSADNGFATRFNETEAALTAIASYYSRLDVAK